MFKFFEKFLTFLYPDINNDNKEHFNGSGAILQFIPIILSIVVSQILLLLLGKFLWNNYLVNAVEVINPIESVLQLFAISILIKLLVK